LQLNLCNFKLLLFWVVTSYEYCQSLRTNFVERRKKDKIA
jgi:hypothetical protein